MLPDTSVTGLRKFNPLILISDQLEPGRCQLFWILGGDEHSSAGILNHFRKGSVGRLYNRDSVCPRFHDRETFGFVVGSRH